MATVVSSAWPKPASSSSLLPHRPHASQRISHPIAFSISIPHSHTCVGFQINTSRKPGFSHSAHHNKRPFPYPISAQKLEDTDAFSVADDLSKVPSSPGIYAVYDKNSELQFIGLTRRISSSLASHVQEIPELCSTVKFCVINAPERAALIDAWKQWMEEHIAWTGKVPPGNENGVTTWTERKGKPSKQDLRLTPGPNVKLNISLPQLIEKVVKDNKVVAFIKGSRTSPQCGFSHRVLTILNEHGIDYESVNVLDEEHNSGLREAIKVYSQWPTIPQVFAYGEFVGGADILEELVTDGKIKAVFQQST